jgi:hypothetical protein
MKTLHVVPRIVAALCALTSFPACAELDGDAAQADPGGELGSAVSELTYNVLHIKAESPTPINVSGNLFSGATDSRTVGGPCSPGMKRAFVQIWADYASISGSWSSWSWVPNSADTDCTAQISMSVGAGGHWDNFHWRIYQLPYNLAPGTTASQSSTLGGAAASRAIDGNADGNWYLGSVTHTSYETMPWWHVDLGVPYPIGTVLVSNRTDCCSDRLSDFDVLVSNDGAAWQWIGGITGPAPTTSAFQTSTTGRFVRVQLRGTNYLSLAEVQVFVP